MNEWQDVELSEVTIDIADGDWVEAKDQGGSDYRLLQVSNIGLGRFRETGKYRYVTEGTFQRLRCTEITPGMILVARMPDPVGRSWFVDHLDGRAITAVDVAIIKPDPSVLDGRFCSYALNTPSQLARWAAEAGGTTRMRITRRQLAAMRLRIPKLSVQRRIAGVLAVFDELIRNNRRRIELLEQMAQAIYLEWFVHFRYPGHEDAVFHDSPLGPIPENWQVKPLRDLIDLDKGLSYKGAHLTETGMPMANLKCLRPEGGFRRASTKPYSGPFKPKHKIVPGDLIVANTDLTQAGAVIGSPAFVPRRGFETGGIISHHLFAIRCAEPAMLPWLYQVFGENRFRDYARGVASGTTVLGFRPADLLSYQVVCPPRDQYRNFNELARNISQLAEDLNDGAEQVATIQDLLLPKLVTGQIEVSKLDLDPILESVT